MQGVDFEFEELGVSEAVGLSLHDADLGIGTFEGAGGNGVVVVGEDSVTVAGQANATTMPKAPPRSSLGLLPAKRQRALFCGQSPTLG